MQVMLLNMKQIVLPREVPNILDAIERLTKGLQVYVLKHTETLMKLNVTTSEQTRND